MMNPPSHLPTLGPHLSAAPMGGPSPPEPPKLPRTSPRPTLSEPRFHDSPIIQQRVLRRATENPSSVRAWLPTSRNSDVPSNSIRFPPPPPNPVGPQILPPHPARIGPYRKPNGAKPLHAAPAPALTNPPPVALGIRSIPSHPIPIPRAQSPFLLCMKPVVAPSPPRLQDQGRKTTELASRGGPCPALQKPCMEHSSFVLCWPHSKEAPSALGDSLRLWGEQAARTDLIRMQGWVCWRRGL